MALLDRTVKEWQQTEWNREKGEDMQPQVGVKLLAAAVRTRPLYMGRTPYQMNYRVPHAALLFSEV